MPTLTRDDAHVYRLDGVVVPGVTSILRDGLLGPDFRGARPGDVERAGERGRAVHVGCALLAEGAEIDWSDLDDEVAGYLRGFLLFLAEKKPRVLAVERFVYSTRWRFAGQLDLECFLDGERTIVDLKSAASLDPSTAPQCAGYRLARNEMTPMEPARRIAGLRLAPNDYRLVDLYEEQPNAEQAFLAALVVANWRKAHGR